MEASTLNVTSARSRGDPSHGGELRHKGSPRLLALTAIGVVFGDIGTSPLYTFSVTLSATGRPGARPPSGPLFIGASLPTLRASS